MDDSLFRDDDVMDQIDWDQLFTADPTLLDFVPEPALFSDASPDLPAGEFSNPSPDSVSLSVDQIEQLLMKDDETEGGVMDQQLSGDFLLDVLLDSPVESGGSGEVLDVSDGKSSHPSPSEEAVEEGNDVVEHKESDINVDGDIDDPASKKRKRQLRNRDAAVRSRERKKSYVKDLEMKSRYFEGECKRLGIMLQCYLAENQALRLSLQNSKALDASMTKQESAVLLLESLLLGSLLWFLGIVCLLILPRPLWSTLEAIPRQSVDNKNQGLAPRKAGSRIFGLKVYQSVIMGKRCKASRPRMKSSECSRGFGGSCETSLYVLGLSIF
ncbi:hypothetical protein RJ639_038195 [Escallonia herrerae]|uniref:BZIP domain-containing protein n=1 Tax=Escallonia herrerae TaxID=1293975 RepID=A0AA88WK23_9ASTE|nr:hypothetical protein RJ639_038195 [Escallonia herrerae]